MAERRPLRLRSPTDAFRLCCRAGGDDLASRRSVTVRHAVYAARAQDPAMAGRWISLATETARTAAERWVFETHEADIFTWTTGHDVLLRLLRSGAGQSLLPVFVGDSEPGLRRVGPPVTALDHPLFIVSHDDERHRPEVRLVIERLAALLKSQATLFAGETDLVPA